MNNAQLSLLVVGVLCLGTLLAACDVTSAPGAAESAPEGTGPRDPAAIAAQSRVDQLREIIPAEMTLVEIVEIDESNDLRITGLTARNRALAELLRAIDQSSLGRPRIESIGIDETGLGKFAITVRSP